MRVVEGNYITENSIVDGPGIRFVIWFQGCKHDCPGCHNPSTHDMRGGQVVTLDEVKERIKMLAEDHSGVTFSGGDPLFQLVDCAELAKYCKELGLNTWLYTGFVYENIAKNKSVQELFQYIDVLVDGRFIEHRKSMDINFRGSTNQRIIDIPESIKRGQIVTLDYDNITPKTTRSSRIYI